jgi:hypothetical protein
MRHSLKPYLNHFVHCSGWIADWEDMQESSNRRICVSDVTIKQPNRLLIFEDQKTITRLEHLNIYCKMASDSIPQCSKYARIAFSGVVIQYKRKDGSIDFGVKQAEMPDFMEILRNFENKTTSTILKAKNQAENYFVYQSFIGSLRKLENQIDALGDHLPTNQCTYQHYTNSIHNLITMLEYATNKIKFVCRNRQLRRKHGIPRDLSDKILA